MPTIQIFSSYNYETLSGLSVRAASCLRQTLRTVATRDLPNSWRFNAETAWCKENPSESFAMKGETMKHVNCKNCKNHICKAECTIFLLPGHCRLSGRRRTCLWWAGMFQTVSVKETKMITFRVKDSTYFKNIICDINIHSNTHCIYRTTQRSR